MYFLSIIVQLVEGNGDNESTEISYRVPISIICLFSSSGF